MTFWEGAIFHFLSRHALPALPLTSVEKPLLPLLPFLTGRSRAPSSHLAWAHDGQEFVSTRAAAEKGSAGQLCVLALSFLAAQQQWLLLWLEKGHELLVTTPNSSQIPHCLSCFRQFLLDDKSTYSKNATLNILENIKNYWPKIGKRDYL